MSEARPETKVFSVKLGEATMQKMGAYAVVFGVPVGAAIRDACELYLRHQMGQSEFDGAVEAFRDRTLAQIALLEDFRNTKNS